MKKIYTVLCVLIFTCSCNANESRPEEVDPKDNQKILIPEENSDSEFRINDETKAQVKAGFLKKIEIIKHETKSGKSKRTEENTELNFIPVLRLKSDTLIKKTKIDITQDRNVLTVAPDVVYFCEIKNGKIIETYSAQYRPYKKFTPEDETFIRGYMGDAEFERMIKIEENKQNYERWIFGFIDDPVTKRERIEEIEKCIEYSDNNEVFIIDIGGTMKPCYFKNDKLMLFDIYKRDKDKITPFELIKADKYSEMMNK